MIWNFLLFEKQNFNTMITVFFQLFRSPSKISNTVLLLIRSFLFMFPILISRLCSLSWYWSLYKWVLDTRIGRLGFISCSNKLIEHLHVFAVYDFFLLLWGTRWIRFAFCLSSNFIWVFHYFPVSAILFKNYQFFFAL